MALAHHKGGFPAKIGLALGSGSARGWAHIGVIRALQEAGISVDFVAGTSIGALVGAVFVSGGLDALEDEARRLRWSRVMSFLDIIFPRSGLIDGKKVVDALGDHVPDRDIEDLPAPFGAVATDLSSGHELDIRSGNVIDAIRASISIPGIFTPVCKGDQVLVDGGLVNPVPVSLAREMGAQFVIAVDIGRDIVLMKDVPEAAESDPQPLEPPDTSGNSPAYHGKLLNALNERIRTFDERARSQVSEWLKRGPKPNIFEVLYTSSMIMQRQITAMRLKAEPPDLLIRPDVNRIGFLDYHRADWSIDAGYREAARQIATLTGNGR